MSRSCPGAGNTCGSSYPLPTSPSTWAGRLCGSDGTGGCWRSPRYRDTGIVVPSPASVQGLSEALLGFLCWDAVSFQRHQMSLRFVDEGKRQAWVSYQDCGDN